MITRNANETKFLSLIWYKSLNIEYIWNTRYKTLWKYMENLKKGLHWYECLTMGKYNVDRNWEVLCATIK